jgi:hypothetical protein
LIKACNSVTITIMNPNNPMGMQPTGQNPYQQPMQPQAASQMKPHRSLGLIIALISFVVLFLLAGGFGIWAFMERGKYKNETDKIVSKEVALAEKRVSSQKDKEFIEKEKIPTKVYKGPATFGSVELSYPKTWSAFINESGRGTNPVNGYLHPDFVPGTDSGTAFALRIEVIAKSYDAELKQFDGDVRSGKVKVTPFRAELVPEVLGARIEGEINKGQKDIMILFPIRDKTLKISTESETFFNDFNNIILKSLKFVP